MREMSQKEIPVDMFDIISREIVLDGFFQYTRSEFETVVNMLPQIKGYLDLHQPCCTFIQGRGNVSSLGVRRGVK